MAEAAQGAKAKTKRGRIVPSRYLQYDRKTAAKADNSLSATKGPERAASVRKPPVQFQKQKNTVDLAGLQSTLLEGHEAARCDLELSAINDKSRPLRPVSKPNTARKCAPRKEQTRTSTDADDLARMLESQTLLLTYANVKMEKNLALLEKKAERNLLALAKEEERLQKDVHWKKQRLLQLKKEQELSAALDMQLEVLGPVAERCAKFQEEYKHFATALDSTRHELPMKGIHTAEDQGLFLAELQEHLAATQRRLKRTLQGHSEHNAEALRPAEELQEESVKLSAELPRSVASVLNLSADVSKEVSLQYQKNCEDTLGLAAAKELYFP